MVPERVQPQMSGTVELYQQDFQRTGQAVRKMRMSAENMAGYSKCSVIS